jgi:hypothetical protein
MSRTTYSGGTNGNTFVAVPGYSAMKSNSSPISGFLRFEVSISCQFGYLSSLDRTGPLV